MSSMTEIEFLFGLEILETVQPHLTFDQSFSLYLIKQTLLGTIQHLILISGNDSNQNIV